MTNLLSWGHGKKAESAGYLVTVDGVPGDLQGGGNSDATGVFKTLGSAAAGTNTGDSAPMQSVAYTKNRAGTAFPRWSP